jgi:short-subunit dehydrogenase
LLESSNRVALITGASAGIGAEFALQLAEKGYDLILVARREDRLKQLSEIINSKYGVTAIPLSADLSSMEGIERVISLIKTTSHLDLLINNAGFGTVGRFSRVDPNKELAMLHVHMLAPVMLCRSVLSGMISQNKGAIINVSSLAGIMPIRNVLYGSSKSFLVNFSLALQDELRDSPLRVQALCPGFILTEFHDTQEYTQFSRSSIPNFLWMTPQEVVRQSLKSLNQRKVICIPGTLYSIVGALAQNSITLGLIKSIARMILHRRKYKLI